MTWLSLIVPIYKVEQYIEECVESIISQLPPDVEVILVNDGTPDNSMQLVHTILAGLSYEKRKQIIIHEQKNQGLSSARNAGINIAKGEYIAFLDSDDILLPDYFKVLENILLHNNVDVIQFKFLCFENDLTIALPAKISIVKEGFFEVDKKLIIEIFNDNNWYAWMRIYRRNLFDQVSFPVGYNYEDVVSVPYLLLSAKSIYLSNDELCGYRNRPDSITRGVNRGLVVKNIKSYDYLISSLSDYSNNDHIFVIILARYFRHFINYSLRFDGLVITYQRWRNYKYILEEFRTHIDLINHRGDYLFMMFSRLGFISYFLVNFLTQVSRGAKAIKGMITS